MAYRDSYRDRAPTRGTRIFVGGLAPRVNQMDVEDLFSRYGRIMRADLKSRSDGSAFAFVEYDDYRDADDAIRKLDGYTFMGGRLQVEASRPPPRMPVGPRPGQMPGGLFNRQDKRVVIEGLSERTSWQDLKDFGREAGAVAYADVFRDRGKIQGVIEYQSREDVRNAVRKLDGVRLQGNTVYLRPEVESGSRERSRSRSRSRSPPRRRDDDDDDRRRRSDSVEDRKREREEDQKARSASPPVRARSDSPRDRSRSPVRPASRSASRSPSRSP